MTEYIRKTLETVELLRGLGEEINDFHVVAFLLKGLPESYDILVTALDARTDDELTLEYVKRTDSNKSEQTTLKVFSKLKKEPTKKLNKDCFFCRKVAHSQKDCYFRKNNAQRYNRKVNIEKENGKNVMEEFLFL